MSGQGKVVAGHYINANVSTGFKGDLVVQTGIKGRKLTAAEVAEWEEVAAEASSGSGAAVAGAVGKIVAGAVLPGFMGKVAGAALDATMKSTARPPRSVRVDWVDGKQSLIRLPEELFTHLTVVLRDRRAAAPLSPEAVAAQSAPQLDIVEQLGKLAGL